MLCQAVEEVLGPAMRVDHPRFFAYVPIPSNYVGMLADALASGFGVFAGTWQAASGGAAAELATVRWLRELFGLPETAGGLFVDGGSPANLSGLVGARRAVLGDRLEGAVLYASDQTHSWIGRAAGLVGCSRPRCACSEATPSTGCARTRWPRCAGPRGCGSTSTAPSGRRPS